MTLDARIAIEALRAGVPNRAAVRLMGTEEPGLEQLEKCNEHEPFVVRCVRGGAGCG